MSEYKVFNDMGIEKSWEELYEDNTMLIQENQQLELELSGYRQAILEDKEMLGLQQENKELYQKYLNAVSDYEQEKFKVEELKKEIIELEESSANTINKQVSRGIDLVNQQQEFIKYLEDELKECNFHSKYIEKKVQEFKGKRVGKTYIANEIVKNECAKKQINKILAKYKEIIGGENE